MATKAKTVAPKAAPAEAKPSVPAVRKATGTSVVSIQDAIKAQVAELGGRIAPASGNKIQCTQDKKFVLPDGTKTDGPLELVIIDFAATNNFYDRPFNKDAIVPPACYAISFNPKVLVPYANSPVIQSKDCQSCPNNEWDTGVNGKGKACSNGRLLAVVPPDADADTPIWLLQASATAIKGFDSYVGTVARTMSTIPVGVVTTVSFSDAAYPVLQFSDPQPNPNVADHFARQAEAKELLIAERDVSGYVPLQPKGKARR